MQKTGMWHIQKVDEVLDAFGTSSDGLTEAQVKERRGEYGPNTIPRAQPRSRLRILLGQLNNPLIYLLSLALVTTLFLEHFTDAIFIAIVLILNTSIGFYQEQKAEHDLVGLQDMLRTRARIIRGGKRHEVDAEELVPGDVVYLAPGNNVPADGRIISADGLKINESTLTGEWRAAEKNTEPIEGKNTSIGDRSNMGYLGTTVSEGNGYLVVTETGSRTQLGAINRLIQGSGGRTTPLQKEILFLTKVLALVIAVLGVFVVVTGILAGRDVSDILVAGVALVASAIPEGLLPTITVILVVGMRAILARGGLVRRLAANETLGSVTVICTDKTGTLTEGDMQVHDVFAADTLLDGSATVQPEKNTKLVGEQVEVLETAARTVSVEAFIENPEAAPEEWIVRGSPTEAALFKAGAETQTIPPETGTGDGTIIDRIPFNPKDKYSAILYRDGEEVVLALIGAPEVVVEKTSYVISKGKERTFTDKHRQTVADHVFTLAEKQFRVIACASARGKKGETIETLMKRVAFSGVVALQDPLRVGVRDAVQTAMRAGVRPVMVTGDHELTARRVGEASGMFSAKARSLVGEDIEGMSDQQLRAAVEQTDLFARVAPEHKVRIVRALQDNGEVVGMVGDGFNDAAALKVSDMGIAMDTAADLTQEVADMILLKNGFAAITSAIEEGRIIFRKIRKVFTYLIADDFAEILLFILAMIFGMPIPLTAAQILWINIVEDGLPALGLIAERGSGSVLREPPRPPEEGLINRPLGTWLIAVFAFTGITAVATFMSVWFITGDIVLTRTVTFAVMSVDSLIFAWSVRSFTHSFISRDMFKNKYLLGAIAIGALLILAAVYVPVLQTVLGTTALDPMWWLLIVGIGLVEVALIDLVKILIFRPGRARG